MIIHEIMEDFGTAVFYYREPGGKALVMQSVDKKLFLFPFFTYCVPRSNRVSFLQSWLNACWFGCRMACNAFDVIDGHNTLSPALATPLLPTWRQNVDWSNHEIMRGF